MSGDKKKALEAFMSKMGAESISAEALTRSFGDLPAPVVPAEYPPERVAMLETLVLALLVERQNLKLEDYFGPLISAEPVVLAHHEVLVESLRQLISDLAHACIDGFPGDNLWILKLLPILDSKIQERLAEKKADRD